MGIIPYFGLTSGSRNWIDMRKILLVIALLAWAPLNATDSTLDLEKYEGKVVVVDFWASWCVPCRRSFPWMNDMHTQYAEDGLVIIAINVDRKSENAAAFLAKYPAKFNIVYDPKAELAKEYGVEVMPSSFIVSRDGEIIDRHTGFKVKRQAEYEEALRAALKLETN